MNDFQWYVEQAKYENKPIIYVSALILFYFIFVSI